MQTRKLPHAHVPGEAVRRWWDEHALNAPTGREVWEHSWPWLVVAAILVVGGCQWGVAMPLLFVTVVLALWVRGRVRG